MENRKILTFEGFVNEEISSKSAILTALAAANLAFTSPALGDEPKQNKKEIVGKEDQIGKDLLGKILKSAPSVKPTKIGEKRMLLCTPFKNIQKEDEKSLESRGWVKVWVENLPDQEVDSIIPPKEPKEIQLDLKKDRSFELGGYDLNEEVQDSIMYLIDMANEEGYEVSEITIESSTDKTPLKETLIRKLKSDGFEPNNVGLSKARSKSIKNFLLSKGFKESDLNVNILSERGKVGGYDLNARYVKLKMMLRNPGESGRTIKKSKKGDVISYFQKIKNYTSKKIPKLKIEIGDNCKVYE